MRASDIPALRALAEASGYPYPTLGADPLAVALVVVNDDDEPIMAAAVEQIWQAYLWCGPASPHERMAALRLLHEDMASCLREKGIESVVAFLPPTVAACFGRRLERTFGWTKNWQSWTKWA